MKENRLWYTRPAEDWNEALPLGNGRLGMMVYGGSACERIQLNEETFWSGWEFFEYDSPETKEHLGEMRRLIFEGKYAEAQELSNRYMICRGNGHHDSKAAYGSYQTAGELTIDFAGVGTEPQPVPENYCRALLLDEGLARVQCGGQTREYFVSYASDAAVIRVTGLSAEPRLNFERENTSIIHDLTGPGRGEFTAVGFLPLKFAVRIRHVYENGTLTVCIAAATAYKTDADPAGESADGEKVDKIVADAAMDYV